MSNASLFHRYEREQTKLLHLAGGRLSRIEVDYPDIPLANLVGPTSKQQLHRVQKEA